MKTLVGILAVAVIAFAVTIGSASNAQLLSNAELGSFVGAYDCECEPGVPNEGDPYCKGTCIDLGEISKRYADPLDEQTKLCIWGMPRRSTCDNDHTLYCGTSVDTREYNVWTGNDTCAGAFNDTIDSYGVELEMANGWDCP